MNSKKKEKKLNRNQVLLEKNDREEAFMDTQEKQAQRDQLVMPVDDISNELLEEREENEKHKRRSAGDDD